ncbi:MAG: TrkH family potassium uptake protein [Candidatus Omnitrophota bacterium]
MHKRLVFNIVSRAVFIVCFFLLLPLFWAIYDNPCSIETNAFVVTIGVGLLLATAGRIFFPLKEHDFEFMNTKDALASVGILWIFLSLWGAMPLWLSGVVETYTDAFFEIASGYTTTGASIFSDIEQLPRGILFWRSLTHWIGGMGVIVLYVALLPAFGGSAYQLYKAETSGLTVDRAAPRLRENAKRLWLIYFLFSGVCLGLLLFGKMPFFDALCHTFGAIATGGFSTKNSSIGAYGPYVQWVLTIFMFAGGVNFLIYYRLFQGKSLKIFQDEEFRLFACLAAFFSLFFAGFLWVKGDVTAPLRTASFQVVSILTATGYATADFDRWPDLMRCLLLFFMFIGGCAGSTSGGLKIVRFLLLVKFSVQSTMKAVYPHAVMPTRFNNKKVSEQTVTNILIYFFLFAALIFTGTLLILLFERTDIMTAVSAALSAASSVGPGLARVGPAENYAWMSIYGKWVLIFLMLAGRLELYAILALFLPATWKK